MKKLLEAILKEDEEVRYELADEDIIKGRNFLDLGEYGDFYVEYVNLEFEDGELFDRGIEIEGTYVTREGEKYKNATLKVDLRLPPGVRITREDIRKGKYTPGEIIKDFEWEWYAIEY